MKKIFLLCGAFIAMTQVGFTQKKTNTVKTDREIWLMQLDKICRPVMMNLAADKLKETMPKTVSIKIDNAAQRTKVAYLEAFGRTLSGIAPWLNGEGGSAAEVALRNQYRQWSLKAIANATDSTAKDYMIWNEGGQPLVDASFVALAFIRCPWLWENLDNTVKTNVVNSLLKTREIVPAYSNWILFTGMIEAFFAKYNYSYDKVRIEFAIREFSQHWYVGDGVFSDGMNYAWDYYNSYVIQPFLSTILEIAATKTDRYNNFVPKLHQITQRYAQIQERMINTDGSYPATGRSIVYRGAAFQHLANMALREELPASLKPAQVRGALTAVIQKTLEAPGTFDKEGWLTIGVYGSQPHLADFYNTTGSLYICSNIFLPLGLPETNEFWSAPPAPWTSVKVWSGQDVDGDHALDLK
ncbi:DUF2264 domain-containing protein [soil metagenome]